MLKQPENTQNSRQWIAWTGKKWFKFKANVLILYPHKFKKKKHEVSRCLPQIYLPFPGRFATFRKAGPPDYHTGWLGARLFRFHWPRSLWESVPECWALSMENSSFFGHVWTLSTVENDWRVNLMLLKNKKHWKMPPLPLWNIGFFTDIEDSSNVRTPVLCWLPTPGIDNKHQYTWATLCVCIEMCEKRQRFKKLANLGCLWNKHYTLLAHSAGKSPCTTAKCGENPRKMVVHVGVPLWSLSVQHPTYWVFQPCSDLSIGYAR